MNNRGFTLIELMIVVAIIGILAAIAFPAYTDHLNKSRRSDATIALIGLQQAQEKLRANCAVYAENLDTALVDADGDKVSFECDPTDADNTSVNYDDESPEKWYDLFILDMDNDVGSDGNPIADGIGYVAIATAKSTGKQSGDSNCLTLVLTVDANNPNGIKSSTDAITLNTANTPTGNATTGCW